ncbi:MAG: hypothetical protein ACF8R7_00325 [Phycisphaerales bacterium JB039]
MIRLACVLGLAAGALCAPATADVILLSHTREILARADDPAGSFTQMGRSSPDGGVFNESVSASAGSHSGFASLNSLVSTTLITGLAETRGAGNLGFPLGQGFGDATMSVQFEVTQATPYRLSGEFSASGSDAGGGLSFFGPAGSVYGLVATPGGGYLETFDESGVLAPGVYELNANIAASVFSPPGADGSFNFVLQVPTPGAAALLGIGVLGVARRRR